MAKGTVAPPRENNSTGFNNRLSAHLRGDRARLGNPDEARLIFGGSCVADAVYFKPLGLRIKAKLLSPKASRQGV